MASLWTEADIFPSDETYIQEEQQTEGWYLMSINKPEYHFFICNSYRVTGEPQGVCNRKGAANLLPYLETEILDRGLDAQVTSCGCVKVCEKGPIMIMYPDGKWFAEVDEEKIDAILDAIEDDESTEAFEL
jgi:(2Fe-2S) ferredoxin